MIDALKGEFLKFHDSILT
jgi:hypothetical protein